MPIRILTSIGSTLRPTRFTFSGWSVMLPE